MKDSTKQDQANLLRKIYRMRGRLLIALILAGAGFIAILTVAPIAQAFSSDLSAARAKYPGITNTRLDDCTLCHASGSFNLNPYGLAFKNSGRDFAAIEALDSDGDGFPNLSEINALSFPGDPSDVPMVPSPTNTPFPPMPTATPTLPPPTATATQPAPTATPTHPAPTATDPGPSPTATEPAPPPSEVPTEPSPTMPAPSPTPVDGALDLDIKGFKVTKHVKLDKVKPVELRLDIKNEGNIDGPGTATIVGMQNGVEVYRETKEVRDAPGNGHSRYFFPEYVPTAPGEIHWTAMLTDGDPDKVQKTARTKVSGDEEPGSFDLDIKDFKVSKHVKLNDKPIELRLDVKNEGDEDGSGIATIVGMQNGVEVYRETMEVRDAPGNGHNRYFFPEYVPTAAGDIHWTATLDDGNPDQDQKMAKTRVSMEEDEPSGGFDLDIEKFKVPKKVELEDGRPIKPEVEIEKEGHGEGHGTATLVGVQNGVEVYRETIEIRDIEDDDHELDFPSYRPTAVGEIRWTLTVTDDDPDRDIATASTTVRE